MALLQRLEVHTSCYCTAQLADDMLKKWTVTVIGWQWLQGFAVKLSGG